MRGRENELLPMHEEEGLHQLPEPPAGTSEFQRHSSLPASRETAKEARHLWVVRPEDVVVALEQSEWANQVHLHEGCIKHSNLTGGNPAHSAGEIWFIEGDRIAINASSGRYGARSREEFEEIVKALCRSGYNVASMGFDLDNNEEPVPNTVFAGTPEWLPPL